MIYEIKNDNITIKERIINILKFSLKYNIKFYDEITIKEIYDNLEYKITIKEILKYFFDNIDDDDIIDLNNIFYKKNILLYEIIKEKNNYKLKYTKKYNNIKEYKKIYDEKNNTIVRNLNKYYDDYYEILTDLYIVNNDTIKEILKELI